METQPAPISEPNAPENEEPTKKRTVRLASSEQREGARESQQGCDFLTTGEDAPSLRYHWWIVKSAPATAHDETRRQDSQTAARCGRFETYESRSRRGRGRGGRRSSRPGW